MVSVIIPNYNHGKFLRQRIDSVLNQSWQDLELIILDDCSGDESAGIIESYRNHPKVSAIEINTSNSGSVFRQWEKGIELAKGTFIWIAESDDVADKDFLSLLMSPMLQDETIRLAFSNSVKIDEHNVASDLMADPHFLVGDKTEVVINAATFCHDYLLRANHIPNASAVVFRKALIPQGLLQEAQQFRLVGDWLFWFNYLNSESGKIFYTSRPLNQYRFHLQTVRFGAANDGRQLLEGFKAIAINQSRISLQENERKALKYGMIEKLIRMWQESGYKFPFKVIMECLKAIGSISSGVYLPFIKSGLAIWLKPAKVKR